MRRILILVILMIIGFTSLLISEDRFVPPFVRIQKDAPLFWYDKSFENWANDMGLNLYLKPKFKSKKRQYADVLTNLGNIKSYDVDKYRIKRDKKDYVFSLPILEKDMLYTKFFSDTVNTFAKKNYKVVLRIANKNTVSKVKKYKLHKENNKWTTKIKLDNGTYIYWYEIGVKAKYVTVDPYNGRICVAGNGVSHSHNEIIIKDNKLKNKNGEVKEYSLKQEGSIIRGISFIDYSGDNYLYMQRMVNWGESFVEWMANKFNFKKSEKKAVLIQTVFATTKLATRGAAYVLKFSNFENVPAKTIVYKNNPTAVSISTITHELVHTSIYIKHKEKAFSLFFNEGLAEYFSTLMEKENYAIVAILNKFETVSPHKTAKYMAYSPAIFAITFLNKDYKDVNYVKNYLKSILSFGKGKHEYFYTPYYKIANSFVAYLFDKYGKEKAYKFIKSGNIVELDSKLSVDSLVDGYFNDLKKFKKQFEYTKKYSADIRKILFYQKDYQRMYQSMNKIFHKKCNSK